jgi:hypothetical protein
MPRPARTTFESGVDALDCYDVIKWNLRQQPVSQTGDKNLSSSGIENHSCTELCIPKMPDKETASCKERKESGSDPETSG